jgi:hypothetical protein
MPLRPSLSFVWLGDGWQNLRLTVRSLSRTPGFTSIALLVIALGIGVNTAVFSVVDAVLLKPLTYPDPQALVQLVTTSNRGPIPVASIPEYNIWQQQSTIFQQMAAYDWGGAGMNLTGGDHPEQMLGVHVTNGYFALFGAPVIAGRTFTAKEDSPNGSHVVVLSYGLWKRRFGGNRKIVGSTIQVNDSRGWSVRRESLSGHVQAVDHSNGVFVAAIWRALASLPPVQLACCSCSSFSVTPWASFHSTRPFAVRPRRTPAALEGEPNV